MKGSPGFYFFDMDHTLIRYKTVNFESLVYDLVIDDLIQHKNYPAAIKEFIFKFNYNFRRYQ